VMVVNNAVWMGHKSFNDTFICNGYLVFNDVM
jgi:hypothetical protein